MMREIDATLTDYGLAIECALLAISLGRSSDRDVTVKWAGAGFFAFMGISAALGGTVHGFCPDLTSTACQALWQLTLQAIGLSAISMWILGTSLIVLGPGRRLLAGVGVLMLVAYSAAAVLVTQQFWIAFTIYLPAALFLLAGFFVAARRAPLPAASERRVPFCRFFPQASRWRRSASTRSISVTTPSRTSSRRPRSASCSGESRDWRYESEGRQTSPRLRPLREPGDSVHSTAAWRSAMRNRGLRAWGHETSAFFEAAWACPGYRQQRQTARSGCPAGGFPESSSSARCSLSPGGPSC